MNFVFLSPHFPPNYYHFARHLHAMGVSVLGLADEDYFNLSPELRSSLTEYYKVDNMENYDSLLRACGYFTHQYGKIDRLDSHNEYWLETEAYLRTDFNIPGIKNDEIPKMKRKSLMKQVFILAGIPVSQGEVVHNLVQARQLTDQIGYPIIAKPDNGVGAAATYKINDEYQLKEFFSQKPPMDYILEEFIDGTIQSFDGIVDQDGRLVFCTAHQYSSGVMEAVNHDELIYYYSLRKIPKDLENAGRRVLEAYAIKERFFHFEFFRKRSDSKLVALEVNIRPPGGLTTDMINYANDIDIYKEWANIIVNNKFTAKTSRPYHCCYIGRKLNRQYRYSHHEIEERFGGKLVHHEAISGVFSAALGDYGYLMRSTDLKEIHSMAEYVHTLA